MIFSCKEFRMYQIKLTKLASVSSYYVKWSITDQQTGRAPASRSQAQVPKYLSCRSSENSLLSTTPTDELRMFLMQACSAIGCSDQYPVLSRSIFNAATHLHASHPPGTVKQHESTKEGHASQPGQHKQTSSTSDPIKRPRLRLPYSRGDKRCSLPIPL